jgi:hypothetical protein
MSKSQMSRVSAMRCVARLRGHAVSRIGKILDVNGALSPSPYGTVVAWN